MNTEEKAKAYDEAIKLAKDSYSYPSYPGFIRADVVFPELKKSEDDETREAILELVKQSSAILSKQNQNNMIVWLEKRDTKNIVEAWKSMRLEVYQQASGNRHEPNCSDDTTKMFSLNDIDEIVEKLNEEKSIDKVEPKFNFSVGQWIVATGKCVYLITKIDGFNVTLVDVDGNEYVFDTTSLEEAHLWTIQDAKDGDVLATSAGAFIYNGNNGGGSCPGSYCGINSLGRFQTGVKTHWTWKNVCPATKEQRDTLMKAMADAGWEFDFEKKELKKIGQKPAEWSEEDKCILLSIKCVIDNVWHSTSDIDTGYSIEELKEMWEWLDEIWQRVKYHTEWSEEDERICQCLIEDQEESLDKVSNDKHGHSEIISDLTEMYDERIDWLKSLRHLKQWKPSDEQIEAIRLARSFVTDDFGEHQTLSEILMELEEQLKALKKLK